MTEEPTSDFPKLPAEVTRRTVFISEKKDYKFLRACRLVVVKGVCAGKELTPHAMLLLQAHGWPGNVRQLRNVIERAAQLCEKPVIGPDDLQLDRTEREAGGEIMADCGLPFKEAKSRLLDRFERQYFCTLLDECGGNLSLAARRAGLARNQVRALCRKHNISCGSDS